VPYIPRVFGFKIHKTFVGAPRQPDSYVQEVMALREELVAQLHIEAAKATGDTVNGIATSRIAAAAGGSGTAAANIPKGSGVKISGLNSAAAAAEADPVSPVQGVAFLQAEADPEARAQQRPPPLGPSIGGYGAIEEADGGEVGCESGDANVEDDVLGCVAGAGGEPKGDSAEDGPGSSAKRKIESDGTTAAISWTICCMDGATFPVEVPESACMAEIKRAIGAAREVPYFAMELFIKGVEDPLDDELRMGSLNRPPLFMLPKVSSERLALVALFKSTGGATEWNDTRGWKELEEDEEAGLDGVSGVAEIDAEGRVTQLLLWEIGMAGPLPGIEILQLSALVVLNLSDNRLTGVIPAELGQLGALAELYLDSNQLSGSIPPELGQLGALTLLYLDNNLLSGRIPAELGQLGALSQLFLHNNQLSGSIPLELGQLGALSNLYLDGGNQLSGKEAFRLSEPHGRAQCRVPSCSLGAIGVHVPPP
jgi:hypothetical protein